jgi:amino acid transporter
LTKKINVWQAAFIGIASMVGAGIFSLLGAAGEVAGAAVWLSFVFAGAIALLQGYSFARFGARYPSAGGFMEYVVRGFGNGHVTGVVAWNVLIVNMIVTALVAVSFGSYSSAAFFHGNAVWAKVFAVLVILLMATLNILGSTAVARAQTIVVIVVIGSLSLFAVVTLANLHQGYLAPSGYPPLHKIVGSVALTFFAFLGFGVVTFTARDLANPSRDLPRALYLALGTATVIYVAVSLGVFGTLTVQQVIDSKGTALAVAAQPVLGQFGFWLMTVTALFATAGATNAGLYPIRGLSEQMVAIGQFPAFLARTVGGRVGVALLLTAAVAAALAALFSLSAIASLGSAVALFVFALITVGHLRVRGETGARAWVLVLALATTLIVLLTFIVTTLLSDPASAVAMVVLLLLGIVLDLLWKRTREARRTATKLELE